jgi:hypothetical protein
MYKHYRENEKGFALPTILVTSVVMLIVLVSAVGAAASVRTALDTQYYSQLAREAAEAGVVRAVDCLKSNGYTQQWAVSPTWDDLRPGSTCAGLDSCGAGCYLVEESDHRTTFEVGQLFTEGDAKRIYSYGSVQLKPTGVSSWRERYESVASARVASSSSVDDVEVIIFGY